MQIDGSAIIGTVNTATGTLYNSILWLITAGMIAGVMYFVMQIMSYKHRLVFRVVTKNGKYVRPMKAKTYQEGHVTWWRVLTPNPFKKWLVAPPPPEAISLTKKGRMFAEANITEDNLNPVWLVDTNKEYGAFRPFTSEQKALYVNQLKKAERRKKRTLTELLTASMPYIFVAVLFMITLLFWEDINRPVLEMQELEEKTAARFESITQEQAEIAAYQSRLLERIEGGGETFPLRQEVK